MHSRVIVKVLFYEHQKKSFHYVRIMIMKSLYPDKGLLFDLLDDVFCAGTPHDTTTKRNSQRNHVTRAGADSCKGDSGGPLVCDIDGTLTLVGIVSKGKMCNKEGFPGIYTNVQAFRTWLDESKFLLFMDISDILKF